MMPYTSVIFISDHINKKGLVFSIGKAIQYIESLCIDLRHSPKDAINAIYEFSKISKMVSNGEIVADKGEAIMIYQAVTGERPIFDIGFFFINLSHSSIKYDHHFNVN